LEDLQKSHKKQCRGEATISDLKKRKASAAGGSQGPGESRGYQQEVCREENKAKKAKKNKK